MPRVVPLPPFDRQFFQGHAEIEVEAGTLFALARALDALFPGLANAIETRGSFAVNGTIQGDWTVKLPADCEVLLVPRISGGQADWNWMDVTPARE